MNDRNQKLRIGMFVIGGVLLLLIMLFFFGMSDFFTHKVAVRTYFSESVQGLTVGSGVKYRGVPIGTVSKIAIRVSDKLVEVNMEIQLDHFVNVEGGRSRQLTEFDRFFRSELEQGMRCRLEYAGITGMRYIDFDYFATPGQELPEPPAGTGPGVLYIPAVPSSFLRHPESVEHLARPDQPHPFRGDFGRVGAQPLRALRPALRSRAQIHDRPDQRRRGEPRNQQPHHFARAERRADQPNRQSA